MMAHVIDTVPLEPVMELLGVFVFGLSGGLAAVRKQFDIVGILVLSWAAALGGGMLRDVLIGDTPPVGISDWRLFGMAFLSGLVAFFFHPSLQRIRRVVLVLDAGGVALFSVAGTLKALEWGGVSFLACAIVGILTAVGGGALRDLLCGEVPGILHQRELYAIPAAVGAGVTVLAWYLGILGAVTATMIVVLVFVLRILAVKFRWKAPQPWTGIRRSRA